ncbi:hypothetical protein, partial [Peribacillus sp. NPDC060253]|uniref:hypothetical protein n=1 Tax=Peribacillus sp. NPDC060253 TaxID=3347084 RepID=UPI00365EC3EC
GHPCIKLTITTAFMVRDSHPIDCTHAGRTKKARVHHTGFSIISNPLDYIIQRQDFYPGTNE